MEDGDDDDDYDATIAAPADPRRTEKMEMDYYHAVCKDGDGDHDEPEDPEDEMQDETKDDDVKHTMQDADLPTLIKMIDDLPPAASTAAPMGKAASSSSAASATSMGRAAKRRIRFNWLDWRWFGAKPKPIRPHDEGLISV